MKTTLSDFKPLLFLQIYQFFPNAHAKTSHK